MSLSNKQESGVAATRPHRSQSLSPASLVIRYVERGQNEVAGLLAKDLTPAERGVAVHGLLDRGLPADQVIRVLS